MSEREIINGIIEFKDSADRIGLKDKTGKILVKPQFNDINAIGKINGEPVIFFNYENGIKIYLADKKKLLFDQYTIIGKNPQLLPNLESDSYGNLFYVMDDQNNFCLVDENANVIFISQEPLRNMNIDGDDLIANGICINLITHKKFELPNGNSIIRCFKISGNYFFIYQIRSSSAFKAYTIYSNSKKQDIATINMLNNCSYLTCSKYFTVKTNSNGFISFDENGNKIIYKSSIVGFSYLYKIHDDIYIGNGDDNTTINTKTGEVVSNYLIQDVLKGTTLMVIASKKGVYSGIQDFDTSDVVVPPFFSYINPSTYKCTIKTNDDNMLYTFIPEKRSFTDIDNKQIIIAVFSINLAGAI